MIPNSSNHELLDSWLIVLAVTLAAAGLAGCSDGPSCGPASGTVSHVVDGDTIDLASGERIRYLMVDTPEDTSTVECFGPEATQLDKDLVLGKQVTLTYDQQCTDRYGRLLAYVSVDGQEVNTVLVERGYACVLHIPPNGDDRVDEFNMLEYRAKLEGRGLWAACSPLPC